MIRPGAGKLPGQRFVLDSHALMAFLEGEASGENVEALLEQALDNGCVLYMSVVNLGEVIYITERERGLAKAQQVLARIDELPIKVIDADRRCALAAAHIKAHWPIAYADCYAAALCQVTDAVLVTGDPEFVPLEAAGAVKVNWISRR
jgi:predicted nucleic acid-binding protein